MARRQLNDSKTTYESASPYGSLVYVVWFLCSFAALRCEFQVVSPQARPSIVISAAHTPLGPERNGSTAPRRRQDLEAKTAELGASDGILLQQPGPKPGWST